MRKRLSLLSIAFVFAYFVLVFNIYNLQIEKGKYYSARAESQNKTAAFLEAVRGNIFFTDRNNNRSPAAINKEYPIIFAVPKEIKNPEEIAGQLASVLNIGKEKLSDVFLKENDPYELLVKKADDNQIEAVKQLKLKGIHIDKERYRFYPFQKLGAHILGFMAQNANDNLSSGKYGAEAFFNKQLSGMNGKMSGDSLTEPKPGEDVVLTIDASIQTKAEDILDNLIKKYQAVGGSVIVEEPKTGKILALANNPTYDPNNYSEYEMKNFFNTAAQGIYEPGSVFKLVTMSAGLNSGKITPDTTFVDKGSVTLNGRTIKNWDGKANGKVTITEVIEKSINTGAVYAVQQIGKDIFYNYLLKFGFNEKTGIELPGEVNNDIKKLKSSFKDIDFATASFGQGVAITPIRLISSLAAIANNGILVKPYIVAGTKITEIRRVISEETARKITDMMVSVVKKGQVAQIPNYYVAGKTGTAKIPDFKNGGYLEGVNIHSFVGFAPAYNPQFIILFKLDKPKGAPVAAVTVGPAFKELAEFILNYYNIPPDYLN